MSSDDDENEINMRSEDEEDRTDEETIITNEYKTETTTITTKKKMKVTSENLPFGHACDDIAADNDTPYVRVYCQNVCGVFDREGIGLESAFKEIKQAGADIFTFNETHGDESNAVARRAIRIETKNVER